MYAIYEKNTKKLICSGPQLTTPKKAWDYFRAHYFYPLRQRPNGVEMRELPGERHYSNFFECKLEGTRVPVLKVPGHKLTVEWNGERGRESVSTGRCTCGWSESGNSRGSVHSEFRHHLTRVGNVDLTPKPAAHQSPTARAEQSLERLKSEGGDRKTFRLGAAALETLSAVVGDKVFPNESAAVDVAIQTLRRTPMRNASIYPIHIDTPAVQSVVEDAVALACRELDRLFPGAAPDGGQGVGSNFQGLLMEHVSAMLTGKNSAQRSHHTELPALLADDTVFGSPFRLPEARGAGYVVVWPNESKVLSAYSGRFLNVVQKPFRLLNSWRTMPLFEEFAVDGIAKTASSRTWAGREMYFENYDVDILFSSHEAALAAALKTLAAMEVSPEKAGLEIVPAAMTDNEGIYEFL